MRIDAATAEFMVALAEQGISGRVLKGPAVAKWLYDDVSPRLYLDSDVLVHPDQVQLAGKVLTALGYERLLDEQLMPEWWREHDSEWLRQADKVSVDLHRSIPGVGVDAAAAWEVLTEAADQVEIAGQMFPTLAPAARALHLALHVGQHGGTAGKPALDLERGLALLDEALWQEAAQLASRLAAIDFFAAGLRATRAGAALAAHLGLPQIGSVEAALRAGVPPPGALTFDKLAGAKRLRDRAAIVWRKLIPPAAYLRVWAPSAARGRLPLAVAYMRRPFWVLRIAPQGLRAYWRARRQVREHRR